MKKLYNRNKELEKWYESNGSKQLQPLPVSEPAALDGGQEGSGIPEMMA